MKWSLLHVVFFKLLFFFVISFLFSFILISQFHFIARQVSFSFSLAMPVNESSSSETRLITMGSGIVSHAMALAQ